MTPVVRVELSRADLLRIHVGLTLRHRSTFIGWLVLTILVAVSIFVSSGVPTTTRAWTVLAVSMVLGATFAIVVGLIWTCVYILISSRPGNGVLGEHLYTLKDEGLLEQTQANETLIKWGGARDLRRVMDSIVIDVAPALCHVIPRQAFATNSEYDAFWAAIQRLKSGVA